MSCRASICNQKLESHCRVRDLDLDVGKHYLNHPCVNIFFALFRGKQTLIFDILSTWWLGNFTYHVTTPQVPLPYKERLERG